MATVSRLQTERLALSDAWRRRALSAVGTIALALAALGLVLPVLPSTCLLIAAAACFSRSSERVRRFLMSSRWLGRPVRTYYETGRLDPATRILSISALWSSLLLWVWLLDWHRGWTLALLAAGLLLSTLLVSMGRRRRESAMETH
ncbi:MAG: hypothetical protein Kow001_05040 [Acidobacteriota bacterium]